MDPVYFPNLKADDAIKSSDASNAYNCISWSGGRTDLGRWFWPPDSNIVNNVWFDRRGAKQSFNNFYGNIDSLGQSRPRGSNPNNCFTYIPTMDLTQSLVDLWANPPSPLYNYTHGSVKKPGDNYLHGYDWKSKPGGNMRTLHPRYALNGGGYGDVVECYKKSGTTVTAMIGQNVKGDKEAEQISLLSGESDKLNSLIKDVPSSQNILFENLYEAWKKTWTSPELIIQSNPDAFFKSDEYAKIAEFCKDNGKVIAPVLLKKCLDGDELAGIAICRLKMFDNVDALMRKTRLESPQGRISADGFYH